MFCSCSFLSHIGQFPLTFLCRSRPLRYSDPVASEHLQGVTCEVVDRALPPLCFRHYYSSTAVLVMTLREIVAILKLLANVATKVEENIRKSVRHIICG